MRRTKLFAGLITAAMVVPMFAINTFAATPQIPITAEYFPDSVMREYVKTSFDTDGNGRLSDTEIADAKILDLYGTQVREIKGVEYLTELQVVDVSHCSNINHADVSLNTNLIFFRAFESMLQRVNLGNNTNLKNVILYDTQLTSLDISGCPNITKLDVSMMKKDDLKYLNIAKNTSLLDTYTNGKIAEKTTYMYYGEGSNFLGVDKNTTILTSCPSGAISITPDIFPDPAVRFVLIDSEYGTDGYLTEAEIRNVKLLNVGNSHLKSLDGTERFVNLESLYLTDTNCFTSFDASCFPKLKTLTIRNSSITSLDVSNNPELEILGVNDSKISSIDVSHNPKLRVLYVEGNLGGLSSLDISGNPELIELYNNPDKYLQDESDKFYLANDTVLKVLRYDAGVTVNTVAPTTAPTTSPSQPTQPSNPSNPSTPAGTSEGGVAGFVERLYTVALGRPSDSTGKANWIAAIRGGESGAEAAKGFLFSDEFLGKNMSNRDFVTTLYKTFFDREPDAAGLNAWVAALERGDSKQDVIMGFINSTEWANVCLRYGIVSGGTGTPSITVEPNEQVVAFATRLYTTCLKRTPDNAGLMAWARQLANLRDTGTNVAHGFFFSDEMLNNPVSDEEYVTRLYLTFMDRNPDEAGFNAWVGQLNSGAASREEVFNGFAASDEFGRICANYGIIR